MTGLLGKIFSRKVHAKHHIEITSDSIFSVIRKNRETLSLVDDWIDESAFRSSCFRYGIPDFIKTEINKPVNESMTYTDLMLFLANKHFDELHYFEIGVSVGKNFFQLINGRERGEFIGFDIEDINPVLEKRLSYTGIHDWDTPGNSIKKTKSSFKEYSYNTKKVGYLSADVWDENSWSKLNGKKFNVVFSDALHTPKAILFEFEMLAKYKLLDSKFIIIWDDLVGNMKKSFYKIIKKYNERYGIKDIYLLEINGWVGQNESPHSVGIISNFKL